MSQKRYNRFCNKVSGKYIRIIIFLFVAFLISFAYGTVYANPEVTDQQISDAVEDELFFDRGVQSDQIDATTLNGIVTLKGEVSNILAKERAARIALIIKGVRGVINEINVDPPVLYRDRDIEREVINTLLHDPATDAYEININVDNNVVTLSGTVQSWKERTLCEKVAKGVKGVVAVNNKIEVSAPEKRHDYEIKKEIEKTLDWDVFVDAALIDVEVSGGKVSLSGTVGSAAEKETATADSFVYGVKEVDNSKLEVSIWERNRDLKKKKYANRTAKEIETAIRDAFLYDPRVSPFEITVDVDPDTKVATLRGTVDNLKAKNAAAGDARNTAGVWTIYNRIKVRPGEKISDQKIKERIKDVLMINPYLDSYEINVNVSNGVADLHGTVDTYFDKAKAEDVVSKVKGVILVENNLIAQDISNIYMYDPWVDTFYPDNYKLYLNTRRFPLKNDKEILKDIEEQMSWSPFVDTGNVDVEVDGGVATLKGEVDSWVEYNSAIKTAYKGGAVYVDNELEVK